MSISPGKVRILLNIQLAVPEAITDGPWCLLYVHTEQSFIGYARSGNRVIKIYTVRDSKPGFWGAGVWYMALLVLHK